MDGLRGRMSSAVGVGDWRYGPTTAGLADRVRAVSAKAWKGNSVEVTIYFARPVNPCATMATLYREPAPAM